jgi:hypothetical protein
MALKLRAARKDQEHCRQILLTLYRMVPARNLRRAARQSLAQRPCMRECVWILEVVAKRLGGDFESSYQDWSSAEFRAQKPGRAADRRKTASRRSARGDAPEGRRRSSRKPRRRSGKQGQRATDGKPEGDRPPKERKEDLPPPWDDSYFFAALPSVPEGSGEDDGTDRYGAATVGKPEAPAGDAATQPPAPARSKPKRRRRRRKPRASGGGETKKPPAPESKG